MDKKVKTGIIAVIVIVIVAFSAFTLYDLNGKSLNFSGSEMRLVVSGSMDADPQPYDIPTIPINSVVMIKHLSQEQISGDLKVGDVIAFNLGGKLITHRIIKVNDNGTFITKGDANLGTETVPFESVIGEVVGVNHWMGLAVHYLQHYSISIFLATVGLVAGYVAVTTSIRNIREDREEKKGQ